VDTERRSLTRPDGRVIEFLVAGPADGLPLVLHEGTPCGLVLYPPTVRAAAIRGLRVVLAARPGYEGSTPRPGISRPLGHGHTPVRATSRPESTAAANAA
jgi:hypothetical protein